MIAENNASSSSNEVKISAAISGNLERTSRQTSMPDPSGSRPSRTATSWTKGRDASNCFLGQAGLSDDDDVAGLLQEVSETVPDHLVVVEEEDTDRFVLGHDVRLCLGHQATLTTSTRPG